MLAIAFARMCVPANGFFLRVWWGFYTVWHTLAHVISETITQDALIGASALIVAVLVPLAILLIEDKDAKIVWDRAVIFKEVLHGPRILISMLLMLLPMLLWKEDRIYIPVLLLVFCVGFGLMLGTIASAYKWISVLEYGHRQSYRTDKRLAYLRSLDNDEASMIWSMTWPDAKGRSLLDDRTLIKEFRNVVYSIDKSSPSATTLLLDFLANMDKLAFADPIVFENIIGITMRWANNLVPRYEKSKGTKTDAFAFRHAARRIYFKLMNVSFQDNFMPYMFFEETVKFLGKNKKKELAGFSKHLSPNFFSIINKGKYDDAVWEHFPQEWLVTSENLKNENREISLAWLNGYLGWLAGKNLYQTSQNEKHDKPADDVTRHLLPKVDPILWSDMMALHWSGFGQNRDETVADAQVRNFIEYDKTFGRFGVVSEFVAAGSAGDSLQGRLNEQWAEIVAINAATSVFPNFRSREKLEELIHAADNYASEDERFIRKRTRLLALLNQLLDELNN